MTIPADRVQHLADAMLQPTKPSHTPGDECLDSADDDVMDIQFVVVPGCPNEAPAAALLRAAVAQAGIPNQCFRVTLVADEQAATHN